MIFADRNEAARKLATLLTQYRDTHPLVLGIPRGGVPMAAIIAYELDGDLDVCLVRKLRAPRNPEYAIGAIDEYGTLLLNGDVADMGVPDEYVAMEREEQLNILLNRRAMYTPIRPPLDPADRTVIVVDDGAATGFTFLTALQSLRVRNPKKLIAAIPVASQEALQDIRELADETVCLQAPASFMTIGQFYEDFSPVSDEQVMGILAGAGARRSGRSPVGENFS